MYPSQSKNSPNTVLVHAMAFFYLTFNTISTIYRAYINDDMPMVALVVFVYVGYFLLHHCLEVYGGLPSHEESPRKEILKATIWGLSSTIVFGFVYELSTTMSVAVVLPIFSLAVMTSAFLFCFYFVYDKYRCGFGFWGSVGESISSCRSSCPAGELAIKCNSENV
ncbi:hypothetical protein Tsubulata_043969 [Turnera subulata]|uniref:Uncharacterized protein n=1 Tax=Turnera subulata TaxID=218843 RepID=A0A9Q0JA01_9ROSI|nr:hypothetical protein Tsubulata_043969 [Turnera subulata]